MHTMHNFIICTFFISACAVSDLGELMEKVESQTVGLWKFLTKTETVYHKFMHLEVEYFFYSKKQEEPTQLFENDFSGLAQSGFCPLKNTVIIIHGYTDHKERKLIVHLRRYIMDNVDVNLIMVDWKRAARQIYFTAVQNSYYVGRQVGAFLQFLELSGVNLTTVHIIGHSLGAQIAGVAGYAVNGQLGRITGLDPAGPMFDFYGIKNKSISLDESDAIFVDVVHTAIGSFGVSTPIGHADFYPNNGGVPQPGCNTLILAVSCSHIQSVFYFAESVNGTIPFMSKQCKSFDGDTAVNCSHVALIPMGFNLPRSTRGVFYLQTNPKSPAAMGGKFFKHPWPFG